MATILADETQATSQIYETIASVRFHEEFDQLLFHIINLGDYGNDIRYRVQASNVEDFTGVETLEDANGNTYWTVTNGDVDFQTLCDPWLFVRVQIRADAPPALENVRCLISGV